jgi:hypothetical protein
MIPVSDLQAIEFVMAGVTAEDLYVQKVKNQWIAKIRNSSSRQLESFIWDLGPKEARMCCGVITQKFGQKLTEAILTNELDLNKLERVVASIKARVEGRVGTDDGANSGKLVSQDSGVLELLRLTILLTIIRQLQRQMQGLVT